MACVQTGCGDVEHAHYAYGGGCVCGSSGSINENASDPNTECHRPADYASCPRCVYACVRRGETCPGAAPAAASSRACDFDSEIVELEALANSITQRGEGLRRLMRVDLPEFPPLNYCVSATGGSISVSITDSSSVAQRIVDSVGAVEGALDILSIFDDGPSPPNLASLSVSVLRSVRGRVIQARTTSSENNAALTFMRDSQTMAEGVNRVRQRMICAVKRGVPLLYRDFTVLERRAADLERRVQANSGCAAGLVRAIRAKLRAARRIRDWHAEGILAPRGTRGGYTHRRTWLDNQLSGTRQPRVFSEVSCR